ncbi:ferritin-like domain-containing protein [Kutzneria sp. 744]|uniref:ferritin-like domain-containing protein n=1 Tax=Kutzneria sp. (strain 744) TaxID=345341 RepID=UPI0003EEA7AB|nr:ferritin-like domain-containing protein [Kutzneria sp. 744]EWM16489.1 basic proline-rich protein [Kutzneria sp. 744]
MTSPSPDQATDSLQQALAAEHAAIWAYGLAGAFLPPASDPALAKGSEAHTARRDATITLVKKAGATPKSAEPGYSTPQPLTNQSSAFVLLVSAEADAAAAWRSVLEHTTDPALRKTALDALTDAAVRAMTWRQTAGQTPSTPPLPGQP